MAFGVRRWQLMNWNGCECLKDAVRVIAGSQSSSGNIVEFGDLELTCGGINAGSQRTDHIHIYLSIYIYIFFWIQQGVRT
jgi:uncharacterized Zn-finger protein